MPNDKGRVAAVPRVDGAPWTAEELEDAVDHLVCCRRSWDVAICGAELSDTFISLIPDRLCPMCMEVAKGRLSGGGGHVNRPVCPIDGDPCPPESEIDAMIESRLT